MKVLFDWVIGLGAIAGIVLVVWLTMLALTRDKFVKISINKQKILIFLVGFLLFAIIPWLFGHFVVHWVMDLFHSSPGPDIHGPHDLPDITKPTP
jgi:hypothetical protein